MRKCLLQPAFLSLVLTTLLGSVSTLEAQYVVTYQGLNSSDPTVSVYDPSTFTNVASFSVPGAFQVLSLANGSKHYFVSNTPGQGVTAVDNAFANPRTVGNIPVPLGAAALSPDSSRLVVATAPMPVSGGNTAVMYVFDTSSDSLTTPAGLSVVTAVSAGIVDVAVSYDSQTAYALGNIGQGQSYLTAISLQQNAVTKTLSMGQPANGLAIGPNGLLYVSAQNKILEVDPASLLITSVGVIDVDAQPRRVTFTPDGHYALAANQTVGTGPSVLLIDLFTHQVAGLVPFTGLGAAFDKLMPASSNIVYAWSSDAQALYTLQIGATGGLILTQPNIPGVSFSAVTAAGLSNDLGVPGRNAPQFLFVVSSGVLYRIDPATYTMTQQVTLTSSPGDLAFCSPTATGNTPVTVLTYGDNQTVAPGGTSLPLVSRFFDANGLPISGVPVNFTVSSGTGTMNPVNAATGADGYVEAVFTAGTTSADIGSFTITVGNSPVPFTVNVGTPVDVPPPAPANLSIVSGQGQLAMMNPITGAQINVIAPLTVLVTDVNSAPVANALVTFTWTSGYGMGFALSGYGLGPGQTSLVLLTDANGQATSTFLPPPIIGANPQFATETITASVAELNSVSFYVTVMPEHIGACGNMTCPPILPLTAYLLKPTARGAVLNGSAGSTLQDAVEIAVASSLGTPIPNVGLQVYTGTSPAASNASCASSTGGGVALTNTSGMATCNLVLNGAAGTLPLTISVGGLVNFPGDTLTVTPGPATQANIVSGNNQAGTVGNSLPLPFVVQVTDSFKNPVPGVAVSWQVTSGSMTLGAASSVTNSMGYATAVGIPTAAGNVTVVLTAGSGSATFKALATVPAAALTINSGNGQSAQINAVFSVPLVVQVMGIHGNPASFTAVSFTVQSGSAALSSSSVLADVNGLASINVTAGSTTGPVTIVATSGSLSATFSLKVLPLGPSNVVIVNAASFNPDIAPGGLATIEGANITPTIQGVTADSSQMAGYSVTFGTWTAPILALVNQSGVQEINVQVPFETVTGSNNVVIQTPQGSLTVNGVVVTPLAPGIFTSGTVLGGYPQAAALRPDGSPVSASNPAQRGESITLFATGLGLTVPLQATNSPGVPGQILSDTVYMGVNHMGVTVVSAVYQPGVLGVYAVTIQIPLTTTAGPAQPISMNIVDTNGTSYAAPDAYLPIQ